MQLQKARKKVKFAAGALIFVGAIGLLHTVYFYFVYLKNAQNISNVTSDEDIKKMILYLLMAIKALAFLVVPGFSIVMITVGVQVLNYLRKEDKQLQIRNESA